MTPADLRAWIRRRHLSHEEGAELLAISVNSLRKYLYGVVPIGRQTERIIDLINQKEPAPESAGQVIKGGNETRATAP